MSAHDINRLVGEFMELYEEWEEAPAASSWERLQALAGEGAQAYNTGNGPSFHILAFDGYPYAEFHERFLGYLLNAGFDPFATVRMAGNANWVPVFGHDGLAAAARDNPVAARMLARLQGIALTRLADADPAERQRIIALCPESIPDDVLQAFAPALAEAH
jgi:hypothetical protein